MRIESNVIRSSVVRLSWKCDLQFNGTAIITILSQLVQVDHCTGHCFKICFGFELQLILANLFVL